MRVLASVLTNTPVHMRECLHATINLTPNDFAHLRVW